MKNIHKIAVCLALTLCVLPITAMILQPQEGSEEVGIITDTNSALIPSDSIIITPQEFNDYDIISDVNIEQQVEFINELRKRYQEDFFEKGKTSVEKRAFIIKEMEIIRQLISDTDFSEAYIAYSRLKELMSQYNMTTYISQLDEYGQKIIQAHFLLILRFFDKNMRSKAHNSFIPLNNFIENYNIQLNAKNKRLYEQVKKHLMPSTRATQTSPRQTKDQTMQAHIRPTTKSQGDQTLPVYQDDGKETEKEPEATTIQTPNTLAVHMLGQALYTIAQQAH